MGGCSPWRRLCINVGFSGFFVTCLIISVNFVIVIEVVLRRRGRFLSIGNTATVITRTCGGCVNVITE